MPIDINHTQPAECEPFLLFVAHHTAPGDMPSHMALSRVLLDKATEYTAAGEHGRAMTARTLEVISTEYAACLAAMYFGPTR